MSWRTVVISGRAKLDLRLGCLIVRRETETRIHLSELSVLIIESTAVSLTAALLSELTAHKVKVIFCDERHNPQAELLPYYGSHDCSLKVKQQTAWSESVRGAVWTEIVREKIYHQAFLLRQIGNPRAAMLEQYQQELRYQDDTNREGLAAKVYFNSLFGMDFTRTADTPINAALNYGYNILLSVVNREITASGYLTQLGLFHDNRFNCFNLSSDLMEPFRPLVDSIVLQLQPAAFGKDERREMLKLFDFTVTINGTEQFFENAVKIYCKSVTDALNSGDLSLLRFYRR